MRTTPQSFTVTEDHVKLLQRMYVQWNDSGYYGAPAIGLKRPYGNSDVLDDIAEIVGYKPTFDREGDLRDEDEEHLLKLHRETEVVLQILLQNPLDFQVGKYQRSTIYGIDYKKVADDVPKLVHFTYYMHEDNEEMEWTLKQQGLSAEHARTVAELNPFYEVKFNCTLDTESGLVTFEVAK